MSQVREAIRVQFSEALLEQSYNIFRPQQHTGKNCISHLCCMKY